MPGDRASDGAGATGQQRHVGAEADQTVELSTSCLLDRGSHHEFGLLGSSRVADEIGEVGEVRHVRSCRRLAADAFEGVERVRGERGTDRRLRVGYADHRTEQVDEVVVGAELDRRADRSDHHRRRAFLLDRRSERVDVAGERRGNPEGHAGAHAPVERPVRRPGQERQHLVAIRQTIGLGVDRHMQTADHEVRQHRSVERRPRGESERSRLVHQEVET